jgi:hypothetical protein
MKIGENKALTEAKNRLDGIKRETAEVEQKLKMEALKTMSYNDDAEAVALRISGRINAQRPIREEVASLIEDLRILNQCRVELGQRVAVLQEAAQVEVRNSFLDRYRSILKERAALSEKLLGVLDKESALYNEVEAAGANSQFHCSDSSMPGALSGRLSLWLEKYKTHRFENK